MKATSPITTKKRLITSFLILTLAIGTGLLSILTPNNQSTTANALTIANINPTSGPIVGGNTITITGSGLTAINPPTTLQNFGVDYCATMDVYNGSNPEAILTIPDARNNQDYQVAKLADGNCWMLNNLKYGGGGDNTFGDVIPTGDGANGTLSDQTVAGGAAYDRAYYYDPAGSDDVANDTFYGYLYNWCAATGGNPATCVDFDKMPPNATGSICPAGWRLPNVGVNWDVDPNNEFSQLSAKMAGFADNQDPTYQNDPYAYYTNWQYNGPFKGALSGFWQNGFYEKGYTSTWWSGSPMPMGLESYSAQMQHLDPSWGVFNAYTLRFSGQSVRCLSSGAASDKPTIMIGDFIISPDDITVSTDGTELSFTAPAHAAGTVDIVVTLNGESQTFEYAYVDDSDADAPESTVPDASNTETSEPIVPGAPNTGVVKWISEK